MTSDSVTLLLPIKMDWDMIMPPYCVLVERKHLSSQRAGKVC